MDHTRESRWVADTAFYFILFYWGVGGRSVGPSALPTEHLGSFYLITWLMIFSATFVYGHTLFRRKDRFGNRCYEPERYVYVYERISYKDSCLLDLIT